ncbi:MAG: hypothetical protein VX640_04135 [Pseudomonadota bacterium]|nr:hypothetical protein [Pseudomonadota bacterium]
MIGLLAALNGALGAVLIAAGLLLGELPYPAIVQAEGGDAFRLVQFHLCLTGFTLLLALRFAGAQRAAALTIFSVNMLLALELFGRWEPSFYWVAALPASSLLGCSYWILVERKAMAGSGEESVSSPIESGDEETLVPEDFGAIEPSLGLTRSYFLFAVILTAGIVASSAMLMYLGLLNAVIFDGVEIAFERLASGLAGVITANAWLIATNVIVLGGAMIIRAFLSAVAARSDVGAVADANRPLSMAERRFIPEYVDGLTAYIEKRAFGLVPRAVLLVWFGLLIVLMSGALVLTMIVEDLVGARLFSVRAQGAAVIHYGGPFLIGGAASAAALGAAASWAFVQYLGGRFPKIAAYFYVHGNWNTFKPSGRTSMDYAKDLARLIRLRMIDVGSGIGFERFLWLGFRAREAMVYKILAFLILLLFAAFALDVGKYELVHENGVRYSKYFDFSSKEAAFSDLDRVELRCFRSEPDGDGSGALTLEYILVKDGAFRIDLLDKEIDGRRLEKLEDLDRILRSATVEKAHASRAGWLFGRKSGFLSTCAEEIDKDYPPETAARLKTLLDAGGDPER